MATPNPDAHPLIAGLSLRFRRRRMRRFVAELGIGPDTLVLDIGGTPECWQLLPDPPRLVLLNVPQAIAWGDKTVQVAGDGCSLPFRDQAFDVVFSNSVIEHVGSEENQRRFAAEAARVGRSYWIQTPNRWFPVEQHLMAPFTHWLPASWQKRIMPWANCWNLLNRVTPERRRFYVHHYLTDVRLLGASGLRKLFPGATLIRERFLGWTKSLVAVRKAS